MPTSKIAAISSEVATGRRMNGRDGLTGRWLSARGRPADRLLGRRTTFDVVLQLLKAAVGHHVAGIDALDRGHVRRR